MLGCTREETLNAVSHAWLDAGPGLVPEDRPYLVPLLLSPWVMAALLLVFLRTLARILAVADKLDTLAGIFAIGKKPSGNRDPFGLRRAALGVIRLSIECGLDLDLKALIAKSIELQPSGKEEPEALALAHRNLGYRAAYCPAVPLHESDRIREISQAFSRHDVVIAEVGRWVNLLDADPVRRVANLKTVTEGLALAEAVGARCCVDIAGSYNTEVWYGPHPRNLSRDFFDAAVENAVAGRLVRVADRIEKNAHVLLPAAHKRIRRCVDHGVDDRARTIPEQVGAGQPPAVCQLQLHGNASVGLFIHARNAHAALGADQFRLGIEGKGIGVGFNETGGQLSDRRVRGRVFVRLETRDLFPAA